MWTVINIYIEAIYKNTNGEVIKFAILKQNVYVCSFNPDLEQLIQYAIKLDNQSNHKKSIEVFNKILSIRPNCFDVHTHIAMPYGIIGQTEKLNFHLREAERLKQEYQKYKPKKFVIDKHRKKPNKLTKKPPKKDKINYWKWLYIYSKLRK